MTSYEETGRIGKDAMDGAMTSFSAVTRGLQQAATETSEFAKRSYEQSAKLIEQLSQSRSLDKVLELQTDYAKAAYESWTSQATKMGEIYADIAKETYKPLKGAMGTIANAGFLPLKTAA